eukprot:5521611-Prymnesium_polylepis.1
MADRAADPGRPASSAGVSSPSQLGRDVPPFERDESGGREEEDLRPGRPSDARRDDNDDVSSVSSEFNFGTERAPEAEQLGRGARRGGGGAAAGPSGAQLQCMDCS